MSGFLGGVASSILATFLITIISHIVFGIRDKSNLLGIYDCVYIVEWEGKPVKEKYERIVIIRRLGKYYGYLIDNSKDNDNIYRKTPENRPRYRLEGRLNRAESKRFIGRWIHPSPLKTKSGAFDILIDADGKVYRGFWTGEHDEKKEVRTGNWTWNKIGELSRFGSLQIIFWSLINTKPIRRQYDNFTNRYR